MIVPKYFEDFDHLHVNTMPNRAYYIPASRRMEDLVENREASDRFFLLSGDWKLDVYKRQKQYHAVTTQLARKDVNEIVIATDAGREGELVARWILDKAHNQKPCKRLWISSVTDKAIREGFANLKDAKEYDNLYRAAVSRAEADWLVGINATRALTCKYNAQLSCCLLYTSRCV